MGTGPHWICLGGAYSTTARRREDMRRARVAANTITAPIVIPDVAIDTATRATL